MTLENLPKNDTAPNVKSGRPEQNVPTESPIGTSMLPKTSKSLSLENQPGLEKKDKTKKVDSMRKEENLTREKIQDLTLKHQAKRLETPVGNHSVLE